MSEPEMLQSSAPPRRRSKLMRMVLVLLLLVAGGLGSYAYFYYRSVGHMEEAFAEADRLDPGWRLTELEANRSPIPAEKNAALYVQGARKLMPRGVLQTAFTEDLEPSEQLREPDIVTLRAELQQAEPALVEARKLADLSAGRFSVPWNARWINAWMAINDEVREVVNLLSAEILLQAQEKDIDGALVTCRARLNTGRSFGDSLNLISLLVRGSCTAGTVSSTERTLAQGEPKSDAPLAALQRLFEDEEAQPLLLHALRGERASADELLQVQLAGAAGTGNRMLDTLAAAVLAGSMKGQRAERLRYMTQLVEAAKLPPEEQSEHMKPLHESMRNQPSLTRLMVPAFEKCCASAWRVRAILRCGIVMLALERYRLAHHTWPSSLDALIPEYLAKVPADPYDGHPLRFQPWKEGVMVYSVGPDGQDNGGKLDPAASAGTDLGVRLWDPAQRRQPAKPASPKNPDEQQP